jgi:TolB-like protein/DNA-binding winged helix-turn-helix (wHTH) protein/Flp pilus assembly protein TadD
VGDAKLHLFGDYALDPKRGCLLRGGEPVHLRPQSYEVLKYLVENPGRLISKDKLIEAVWRGRAVTDDSLVQCLRDVRHALGQHGAQFVRNVRGRGYIFDRPEGHEDVTPPTVRADQLDIISVLVEEEDEALVTPAGAAPAARHHLEPTALSRRTAAVLGASVLLLVASTWFATRSPGSTEIRSIAVLPFVNETGELDEYLSEGLTDSLINSLSQMPGLSVKARSSVSRYEGKAVEPQRVAAELSVQAVLSGRTLRRGDELTVYLSLVDGRTGNQIWGEQSSRRLTDLAALQHDVARDVSEKLQARVSGADRQTTPPAANPEAYLLYLKGRYYARKQSEPEIRKGIAFYQQAVDADPTYALAYAGMADAFRALPIVGRVPSKEAFPQARAAARRALEIDDSLVDAHVALGWIRFSFDWDWIAAEEELLRAISLSPENSDAHRAYAHLLSNLGRHDEALVEIGVARELDPLMLLTNALEGQFLFYAGRDREAEVRFRKTLELEPNYWVAHNGLGRVYLLRKMFPEAVAAFTSARALAPESLEPIPQLGYALARWGKRDEARAILRELEARAAAHHVPAYSFAMIHNGLGEREQALSYLERSLVQREVQLTFMTIDTRWDDLRSDPRFFAIVRRVGLE